MDGLRAPVTFDRSSSAATGPVFTQQIMQKLREQAQELGSVRRELDSSRAYARLCEQRILDLSPEHPLPVSQAHLGQGVAVDRTAGASFSASGSTAAATNASLRQELQEQKLYIQMLEDEVQATAAGTRGDNPSSSELLAEVKKLRDEAARAQDLLLQQRRHSERLERELQNALYSTQSGGNANTEALRRNLATLQGQVGELETEKNALLGYVQDNMQRTAELQQKLDTEAGTATQHAERVRAAEARLELEEARVAELKEAAAEADAQLRNVREQGKAELAAAHDRYEQLFLGERARADALASEVVSKSQEVDEIVGLHGEYIASAEELQAQYQAEVQARAALAGEARSLQTRLELAHDQHAAAQTDLLKEVEAARQASRADVDAEVQRRVDNLEAKLKDASQREALTKEVDTQRQENMRAQLLAEAAELHDARTEEAAYQRANLAAAAAEERLRAEVALVRRNAELETALLKGKLQALDLKRGKRHTRKQRRTGHGGSSVSEDGFSTSETDNDGRQRNSRRRGRSRGSRDELKRARELASLRGELEEAAKLLETQEKDIRLLRAEQERHSQAQQKQEQEQHHREATSAAAAAVAHEVVGALRQELGHVRQGLESEAKLTAKTESSRSRGGVRRGTGFAASTSGPPDLRNQNKPSGVDSEAVGLRAALASLQEKYAELQVAAREQRALWEGEINSIGELQVALEKTLSDTRDELRRTKAAAATARSDASREVLEADAQIAALQRELSALADEVCCNFSMG